MSFRLCLSILCFATTREQRKRVSEVGLPVHWIQDRIAKTHFVVKKEQEFT